MNKKELMDRFEKLPDRGKKLLENYPVVAGAVFGLGLVTGLLIGWLL